MNIELGNEIESKFARMRHYVEARINIATLRAARALSEQLYEAYRAVGAQLPPATGDELRQPFGVVRSPLDRLAYECDGIWSVAYITQYERFRT